jgi:hypothetical protein
VYGIESRVLGAGTPYVQGAKAQSVIEGKDGDDTMNVVAFRVQMWTVRPVVLPPNRTDCISKGTVSQTWRKCRPRGIQNGGMSVTIHCYDPPAVVAAP